MAVILEQDKINELVRLQAELEAKQELAKSAIEKLEFMYKETTGSTNYFPLISLADIGFYIDELEKEIKSDSVYIDDFMRLRTSYLTRIENQRK